MGAAKRPRTPGATYAMLTLVLLVLLATFALTVNQPPPPTIAEFAPQSVESITDAPTDQSSSSGTGSGDCAAGQACGDGDGLGGELVATPAPIDVPRVRRCVGDPPRQIEDPQSPPCVPYWSGDNGGATSKGVTRDEIRVVDADYEWSAEYAPFFNKRFEFYGRKLNVIDASAMEGGGAAGQRADGVMADEEFNAFASAIYRKGSGDTGYFYYDELAKRGIVASTARAQHTEAYMAEHHPFVWSYVMSPDREFALMGEWICKRLSGRPSIYGGDTPTPRTFGIILHVFNTDFERYFREAIAGMRRELQSCGETPVEAVVGGADGAGADVLSNAVLKMKTGGVTSVACLCGYVQSGQMAALATAQAYSPEWLLTTYFLGDTNIGLSGWPDRNQLSHAFGITVQPRQIRASNTPASWALREIGRPEGAAESTAITREAFDRGYRSMLQLASGIQMAGPDLTPASFARGLQQTRFPNPETPLHSGKVGYLDGDHSMTNDIAEWWWSQTDTGPYNDGNGTICYVDGGVRRERGAVPPGDGVFFKQPCVSGA